MKEGRKAYWIGYIGPKLPFKIHYCRKKIVGVIVVKGRRRLRRNRLLEANERIVEIERRRTKSLSGENSFWKRLWTCRKTDYGIIGYALYSFPLKLYPMYPCNTF